MTTYDKNTLARVIKVKTKKTMCKREEKTGNKPIALSLEIISEGTHVQHQRITSHFQEQDVKNNAERY